MTYRADEHAALAIDITDRGLAFSFFERGELLDWGERTTRGEGSSEIALVDQLLDGTNATLLVLEDPDASGHPRSDRIREILRAISRHVAKRGIAQAKVSRHEVRAAWRKAGCIKEQMAVKIAERFAELAPSVPPPRKTYASETRRQNLFDAASYYLYLFNILP